MPKKVVAIFQLALVAVERPAAGLAALRDDDALGAAIGNGDLACDRVRLVLQRQHASLAHAHAREQKLLVSTNELRSAGDVGVDPLKAAIVERHDVVLHRFDQPEPLQFRQFLRILGGEVLRLRPVVGAIKLPDVIVERRRRIRLPRRSMLRHRRPTLMIDAAIAHHLEILDVVRFGRFRVAERGRHADTLERAPARSR